eukprot:scaffold14205_cov39-Isochrysis_galbana.AAC.1
MKLGARARARVRAELRVRVRVSQLQAWASGVGLGLGLGIGSAEAHLDSLGHRVRVEPGGDHGGALLGHSHALCPSEHLR